MTFSRIIVHAGLSKTGSTSIQASCERHRELLRSHGVIYPGFQFGGKDFENHSLPLTLAVSERPGRYALGLRQRFGEEVAEAIAACRGQFREILDEGGDTLVLSSERIAGFEPDDLAALAALLEPRSERVSLLLYLRSPFELLESILQERAKAGAVVDPIAVVGRSRRRVQNVTECFGDHVQLVNYHKARLEPGGGLVADFLRYCGIPSVALEGLSFGRQNTRMSLEGFQLMDAVNRRFPRRDESEHGVQRAAGDLRALQSLPGHKFSFPWEPGSEIYAACLEEYEWFRDELGQDFPSPPQSSSALLWQEESREALPAMLASVESLPIRNFLEEHLRDNGIAY